MDSAWGSRKTTRAHGDSSTGTGGSKLIQLQRQSSAIGPVPTLSTNALSGSGPLSSHGSSGINLSSFLTGSSSSVLEPSSSSSLSSSLPRDNHHHHSSGTASAALLNSSSSSRSVALSGSHGGGGAIGSVTSGTVAGVIPGLVGEIHPLHFNWVFWFMHRAPGSRILNYESSMKKIATFGSVEDFWAVYSHLRRPHELPNVSDYHLFKQGVRPVWEDAANINGGKWIVRLKKGLASRYWENLVMAVIGDQFDVGSEICGIVLSIRGAEDILSIWNQSAHEGRINLKIRDTMKRILSLPADTIMEYKTHNDALKDNTSFRNTDVFR
ncbi:Eukaryotic translation initiation factor 4E type 2 [Podila verticillata]|nr:Eukaryotic translation initiation factor 4E type 2 [Podila verticillata]